MESGEKVNIYSLYDKHIGLGDNINLGNELKNRKDKKDKIRQYIKEINKKLGLTRDKDKSISTHIVDRDYIILK